MEQEKSLIGKKEIEEYKNFAFKDDVLKLAVGVMLGNAFNKVVYGMSDYLAMPVFTFLVSQTGDHWRQWNFSPFYGLRFEIGKLLGCFVDFVVISIVLYLFYIKLVGRFIGGAQKKRLLPCPMCFEPIDERAKKCPRCTGDLIVKTRRVRSKNTGTKNRRSK